jgi:two-component sensor histidine kinase/ligand-binding sensor domain-containing protein
MAHDIFALERLADLDQIRFERFGTQDGLSQPTIASITQAASGRIWIGTQDGLNVFDGYSFTRKDLGLNTTETVSRSSIKSVFSSTKSNTIYFTAANTLFKIEPKTVPKAVQTIEGEDLLKVIKVGNFIYIATARAAYRLDETSNQLEEIQGIEDSQIRTLAEVAPGSIYIGTDSAIYKLEDLVASKLLNVEARDIASKDQRIWIASGKNGTLVLDADGKITEWHKHATSGGLPGTESRTILHTRGADTWIGTNEGILIIEKNGARRELQHNSNNQDSLSHNHVTSVFEDSNGTVWIGTFNGLNKYSPDRNLFPLINQQSVHGLVDNSIISFHEKPDGTLLIGTANGISSWSKSDDFLNQYSASALNLPDSRVMALKSIAERILIGTMLGGAHAFHGVTNSSARERQTLNLPSDAISSLEEFQEHLIIGTYDAGAFRVEINDLVDESLNPSFQKLTDEPVLHTYIDNEGALWLITPMSFLYAYTSLSSIPKDFTIEIKETFDTPDFKLNSIRQHGDEIWIGTLGSGLGRYNRKTGEKTVYSTKRGLPSNVIYSIEIDNHKNIWISTTRGLSRLNPETGEIRNFNTSHGLQGDDFNGNASIKLSDGTLLFGGNNGFNAFDPSKIAFNDYQGQTLITAFSKMNQPQSGRFLSDGSETIELSYKENVFSFEFALMDFTAPSDNTFEYQLVGFDEDWINSGRRNNVSYTNLDAGNYEFRVRGFNNDGVVTDKIASVHVSVAPPLWRTWYAYLAYALVAIIMFVSAFRFYTARVIRITNEKRNAEERQRLEALVAERTAELNEKIKEQAITLQQKEIANKEIHHRVKNNLQVILGLLTLQAETEENEHFQSAMNEIRQRITSMSLIHKSLYEHTVATIDIKQYAENLINSIRQFHPEVANGNIEVILEVGNETLDIDTALPVGLVLNELITNCLKHGFADAKPSSDLKIIKVMFQRQGSNYVLTVSDNGAGLPHDFDINSPSSMGSELILIFAQQLDGQISAENLKTGGAAFTLSFPVSEAKLL